MQNWPKPLLHRRQTNPELRPLSASEQESVEQARPLISQIQSLSGTDLDRRAVVVTDDGVGTTRAWTRRGKSKSLELTLNALRTRVPIHRSESLQRQLSTAVDVLTSTTDDPQIRKSLETVVEQGVVGSTLDRAIEAALRHGLLIDLLGFEADCWDQARIEKLLLRKGRLRKRSTHVAKALLTAWLSQESAETCLRDDGPAPQLLMCVVGNLATKHLQFDSNTSAIDLFSQCCLAIQGFPPRLLRLLGYVAELPALSPTTLLTCIFLRHFLPRAYACGLPVETGKQLLVFCHTPALDVQALQAATLAALTRA